MIRVSFYIYRSNRLVKRLSSDMGLQEFHDKVYEIRSWCRSNYVPDLTFKLEVLYVDTTQNFLYTYDDRLGSFVAWAR